MRIIRAICFLSVLFVLDSVPIFSGMSSEEESRLISVLESESGNDSDVLFRKVEAIRKLTVFGTENSVPVLIDLLGDERLDSYARTALENIPAPKLADVLRDFLEDSNDRKKLNIVRILGNLEDEKSVTEIGKFATGENEELALCAIESLGKIGSDPAVNRLKNLLDSSKPDRVAAAACSLLGVCERTIEKNRGLIGREEFKNVTDIARTIRGKKSLPDQYRIGASRALVLGSGKQGEELVIALLNSEDETMFKAALGVAREFSSDNFVRLYSSEIAKLPPERQPNAIRVLMDRTDVKFLPSAILKIAREGEKPAKLATIELMSVHGHGGCVPYLLETLESEDSDIAENARKTLAELKGEEFDDSIMLELRNDKPPVRLAAIMLIGERGISNAKGELAGISVDPEEKPENRNAAIVSLGSVADPDMLPGMIHAMNKSTTDAERKTWLESIEKAASRAPDRDICTRKLMLGLEDAKIETKCAILEILPLIGGETALKSLAGAALDKETALKDSATKALGEWIGSDAAPLLLHLAKTYKDEKNERLQIRTLRGLLRSIRQFEMPNEDRIRLAKEAIPLCSREEERKMFEDFISKTQK